MSKDIVHISEKAATREKSAGHGRGSEGGLQKGPGENLVSIRRPLQITRSALS
jgi:hypothetical protein